jgi:hypothetical protein
MTQQPPASAPEGSVGRRRIGRAAVLAAAASALLVPGIAAAAEGDGGGGGGGGGEGGPTSLVFVLTWETDDGVALDALPAPSLAGFDAVSFNAGGEQMGTATCTQAAGTADLTCTYDNRGHGSVPGLVLPRSPKASFTVTVTSVPTGWTVDPATVGTFAGGEACPREDGHHDDGGGGGHHDDGGGGGHHDTTTTATTTQLGAAPAAEGDGGTGGDGAEPVTCTHTVVLVQDPIPPPPPPPSPPVAPSPDVLAGAVSAAAPVETSPAVTG